MLPNRWSHLVRHGLLSTTLVGAIAAPAAAEPCGAYGQAEEMVGFTLGVDISPKLSLIGGIEARKCVSDKTDVMLRLELGGGGVRMIGGARARPFEDNRYEDYDDSASDLLGVEAGLAIDFAGNFGAHLGASYGPSYAYLAAQALFPLSTRPNAPSVTRTSLIAAFSPWAAFESTVVEGRPLSVGGRFLAPEVLAQLANARSAEDRAVRDHFTRSARYEYSSVWTFLRLAAELHAVGAPAALIAAALDAADDEVRHAELCAQAAGGLALAPLSMLAAQPRFTQRSANALALLAAEAWCEGCLNEGAAAEEARLAAGEAQGPTSAMLSVIARDEATHAALAWAVLAWVQSIAPDVARAAVASVPATEITEDVASDPALARRGVASSEVRAAAHAHAHDAATMRLRDLLG